MVVALFGLSPHERYRARWFQQPRAADRFSHMDRVGLGKVLEELKARGFEAQRQQRGVHRFQGALDCRGEAVRIELAFSNLEFLTYPSIKVLSGVDKTLLTPHLFASGGL